MEQSPCSVWVNGFKNPKNHQFAVNLLGASGAEARTQQSTLLLV